MLFKRVMFNGVRVIIDYEEVDERYTTQQRRTSAELPRPEFINRLRDVGDVASRILVGKSYFVTESVKLLYGEDRDRPVGLLVTGLLAGKPEAVVRLKVGSIPTDLIRAVDALLDEAQAYLDGQSAQGDLFEAVVPTGIMMLPSEETVSA